MGQRGEVFSTRVFVDEGQKTYFFNVKENRYRDLYLNIVESRKTDRDFRRSSIVVFLEDLEKFMQCLDNSVQRIRRRELVDATLTVGGGRRIYNLNVTTRRKPALRIAEKREDAIGFRSEAIFVSIDALDVFLEGLQKSIVALKS